MANKKVNICWLIGNYNQRQLILSKIKNSDGFDIDILDSDISLEYFRAIISENSCFGRRKLIILNEYPKSDSKNYAKDFIYALKCISGDVVVVLNNLSTRYSTIKKFVKENGKIYEYDDELTKNKASVFIKKLFEQNGYHIESKAVNVLIETFGSYNNKISIDKLYTLYNKITSYIGNSKKITYKKIIPCCSDQSDFVIWSLFDALDQHDSKGCMDIFHRFIEQSVNIKGDFEFIVSNFLWRFELLCLLKMSEDPTSLGSLKKIKFEGSSFNSIAKLKYDKEEAMSMYSDKAINVLLNGFYDKPAAISRYSKKTLIQIIYSLHKIYNNLREGFSDIKIKMMFEYLFLFICKNIHYKHLNSLLRNTSYEF